MRYGKTPPPEQLSTTCCPNCPFATCVIVSTHPFCKILIVFSFRIITHPRVPVRGVQRTLYFSLSVADAHSRIASFWPHICLIIVNYSLGAAQQTDRPPPTPHTRHRHAIRTLKRDVDFRVSEVATAGATCAETIPTFVSYFLFIIGASGSGICRSGHTRSMRFFPLLPYCVFTLVGLCYTPRPSLI